MASSHEPAGVAPGGSVGRTRRSVRETVRAYKDLAKLDIFDVYLTVPLAWSLLEPDLWLDGRSIAVLLLVLVGQVGIVTAACAFDDISGLRDGIDPVTYGPSESLRKRRRKPLVDHRLSEREALAYAYGAVITGVLALAVAYVVSDGPAWLLLGAAGVSLGALAYSWGPKLSYHGLQDAVVILCLGGTFVLTYAVVPGRVEAIAVFEGLLLGIWLMQMTIFGNVHDREADRAAGRVTMAVRLSEAGLRRYTLAMYGLGWAVLGAGLVSGELPWYALLLTLPALVLQLVIVRDAVLGPNALKGRLLGIHVLRVGIVGLFATNLILMH